MKLYRVRMLPEARIDIAEAREWYRQYTQDLPGRLSKEISNTVKIIKSRPFTHAIRYQDVRVAATDIFPYAVHYYIDGETIVVIAVHHTALSSSRRRR